MRYLYTLLILILISCTTGDFIPYNGSQEEWPYGKGSFSTEFKGILFYDGLPDKPYEVIGYIDLPVYAGLNCPPESAETCWKRVIARLAKERSCDAVIVAGEKTESIGSFSQVLPGFFGPIIVTDTNEKKTRRAIFIKFKKYYAEYKDQKTNVADNRENVSYRKNLDANKNIGNLSPDKPYDFRRANWNMSKMEVEATENLMPVTKDEKSITFKDKIFGLECYIIYSFDNDRLIRGTIIITEIHSDLNLYINDYNNIRNVLTGKYGKPSDENIVWRNSEYKENMAMWGEAVKIGHLIMYSKWNYDNVIIHLQISSEEGKIKLGIQYRKP